MKTCETCRFMAAERASQSKGDGFGYMYDEDYVNVKDSGHRTCVRIIHGNSNRHNSDEVVLKELAVVTDGSGYAARLAVLPSFGCVLHEAKT